MRTTLRNTLIALALVLVSSATCVMGYFWGVNDGTVSLADAVFMTEALKDLRTGNEQRAIQLLESQLDGRIVAYAVTRDTFSPARALFGDLNAPLVQHIAKYRSAYPSQSESPEIRSLVAGVVGASGK